MQIKIDLHIIFLEVNNSSDMPEYLVNKINNFINKYFLIEN